MRKTTLAVVISSVLLGAVAAQAEPTMDPTQSQATQTQPTQTSSPTDTGQTAGSATSQDADPTSGGNANEDVGTPASNVDEKSSSGSYYPNSAGTVGDTPAAPKSTSPTADVGGDPTAPTDQWVSGDADGDGSLSKDELAKISPRLESSFGAMDVDSDGKLTRGEFRTWHESHKARMDADQPATTASGGGTSSGGDWSGSTGSTAAPARAPGSTSTPDSTSTPGSMSMPGATATPDSTTAPDATASDAQMPKDTGN